MRPVPGGFALSGGWRVPASAGLGPWLVLPLPRPGQGPDDTEADHRLPDLYVVPSRSLPASTGITGGCVNAPLAPGAAFPLHGFFVPTGHASHSSGRALYGEHSSFVWTAVTGMALGAAGRLTGELAALGAAADSSRVAATSALQPKAVATELAALLRHERLGFTADLHNGPGLGRLVSLAARAPLPDRVGRAAALVQRVVTAAYEHTVLFPAHDARHPLESLLLDSFAALQHLRSTVDLLLTDGASSPTEGEPP
ncbi:hypothetical protein ACVHNB_21210 [Streptomyces sp. YJ-C3]